MPRPPPRPGHAVRPGQPPPQPRAGGNKRPPASTAAAVQLWEEFVVGFKKMTLLNVEWTVITGNRSPSHSLCWCLFWHENDQISTRHSIPVGNRFPKIILTLSNFYTVKIHFKLWMDKKDNLLRCIMIFSWNKDLQVHRAFLSVHITISNVRWIRDKEVPLAARFTRRTPLLWEELCVDTVLRTKFTKISSK